MGLASKMNSFYAAGAPVGVAGPQYGSATAIPNAFPLPHHQQQQQQQQQQPQFQYQQPPVMPAPGAYGRPPPPPPPAQMQYSQPPQPQMQSQPQYMNQAPMASAGPFRDPRYLQSVLEGCVREKNLSSFYPPGSNATAQIAQVIAQSGVLAQLSSEWRLQGEMATDLVKLALFDVILYVDDSGSMQFEENGSRIEDLRLILNRVAKVAGKFDDDGLSVRFMNSDLEADGVKQEDQVARVLQSIRFAGITPLGSSMRRRILDPLVMAKAAAGRLKKPVLIITVTDGEPVGEARFRVAEEIKAVTQALRQTRYGPDAVSFQFAQVGNDTKAMQFLSELDGLPEIGRRIDCTSNYELEADEMQRRTGMQLTPDMWMIKLLLGAIDSSYDSHDEPQRTSRL